MKKRDAAEYLLFAIHFILFGLVFYVSNNLFYAFTMFKGLEAFKYVITIADSFKFSLRLQDIMVGFITGALFFTYLHMKAKNKRKTRDKEEYGSARWGTQNEIKPYMDMQNAENNIILSKTERLRLNGSPSDYKYDRNKNVVILGGSGSGKTRGYVIPNILQAHSSFVITDPKGDILKDVGKVLLKKGFKIRVINLKDPKSVKTQSMKYNPIYYAKNELNILTLVDTLIANTSGDKNQQREDFWVKAEKILYLALIDYVVNHTPEENQNFISILEIIREMEVREDDETFQNPIDILFKELEEEGVWRIGENGKPYFTEGAKLFCVGKYKEYKIAAGKTAKSILISCIARLSSFGIPEIADFTSTNEIDMEEIGESKTALFIIISDTNRTLNFLVSMFYTQLFNQLVNLADNKYGGQLPIPVRCILDEFANIGLIPEFQILIATIRSRLISASIILQTITQLKSIYKDDMDTIIGNCDTTIYLGGKEPSTLKYVSEALGKETIDITTTGKSKSRDESHSTNYQRIARSLMTQDELGVMDNSLGIVMIRGERPFKSLKYKLEQHPLYKETGKYSKANLFDIEKYLKFIRHKEKQARISDKKIIDERSVDERSDEGQEEQVDLTLQEILKKHEITL